MIATLPPFSKVLLSVFQELNTNWGSTLGSIVFKSSINTVSEYGKTETIFPLILTDSFYASNHDNVTLYIYKKPSIIYDIEIFSSI